MSLYITNCHKLSQRVTTTCHYYVSRLRVTTTCHYYVSLYVTICHYTSLYVIHLHTFTYQSCAGCIAGCIWLHLLRLLLSSLQIVAHCSTLLHVAPRFPGHTFFVVDISQISRRVRVRRLSGRDISSPSPDASHNRVHTRFDRIRTRFCGSRCLNKIYDLKMLKSYCNK